MRPVPVKKRALVRVKEVGVCYIACEAILLRKRPPQGLWANLWELPTRPIASKQMAAVAARDLLHALGVESALEPLESVSHSYTHHRATLYPYLALTEEPPQESTVGGFVFVPLGELAGLAFSSAHRRVLDRLLSQEP